MPRAILRIDTIRRYPSAEGADPVDTPLAVPVIVQVHVTDQELSAWRSGAPVAITVVGSLQSAV